MPVEISAVTEICSKKRRSAMTGIWTTETDVVTNAKLRSTEPKMSVEMQGKTQEKNAMKDL